MKKTLFVIRLSKIVKHEKLLEPDGIISIWETPKAHFPGEGHPKHIDDLHEINVWVTNPNTFKGLIADWNDHWAGLQIGIVDERLGR